MSEDKNTNITITITWYDKEPISLWYGEKLVWETKRIVPETNIIESILILPFNEAAQFCIIFLNGLTANYLSNLLITVKAQISQLHNIQTLLIKTKDDAMDDIDSTINVDGVIKTHELEDIVETQEDTMNIDNDDDNDNDDENWEN